MPRLMACAATALAQGRRARQEDSVLADFPQGEDMGLAVLSDGMGGHADGDTASRIIVSEVFSELFFTARNAEALRRDGAGALRAAVRAANQSLRAHVEVGSGQPGMGGTVLSAILTGDTLRWISVGDSPLFLFRAGRLWRLNEDHSMAPQIALMVREGAMDAETARNHPQRNALTSALTGGEIGRIDCPEAAIALAEGDIIVMASDGLQVLPENRIERILHRHRHHDCHGIAQALLDAVDGLAMPDQDNVSLVVIRMEPAEPAMQPVGLRAIADWLLSAPGDRRGAYSHRVAR